MLVDVLGRPLRLVLTPGNTSDVKGADLLIGETVGMKRVIADRGYDANRVHGIVDQIADVTHTFLTSVSVNKRDLRALGVGLQMIPPGLLRHPEHIGSKVFLRIFRIGVLLARKLCVLRFESLGNVLEENQTKRDVLVFGRLKITAQLIGSFE